MWFIYTFSYLYVFVYVHICVWIMCMLILVEALGKKTWNNHYFIFSACKYFEFSIIFPVIEGYIYFITEYMKYRKQYIPNSVHWKNRKQKLWTEEQREFSNA